MKCFACSCEVRKDSDTNENRQFFNIAFFIRINTAANIGNNICNDCLGLWELFVKQRAPLWGAEFLVYLLHKQAQAFATRAGLLKARQKGITLGRPSKVDKAPILELRESGFSFRQISSQLGVSRGAVCRAIKKQNQEKLKENKYAI